LLSAEQVHVGLRVEPGVSVQVEKRTVGSIGNRSVTLVRRVWILTGGYWCRGKCVEVPVRKERFVTY